MTWGRRIFAAFVVLGLFSIAVASYFNPSVNAETKRKAEWYDRFCWTTREAMRADRRAFETGTPAEKELAFTRFWSSTTIYHDAGSLALCLGDKLPATPICMLDKDWPCLATFARALEQALPTQ